jgi:hypothetical protein
VLASNCGSGWIDSVKVFRGSVRLARQFGSRRAEAIGESVERCVLGGSRSASEELA